ncbi:MAG: hypothetical protein A3B68_07670 [Candidatus Melainabacteria bacterium RIFCSPHIGHO2_02_FULL_34_12]|nr:MAG: hypothetical protein A3B68_07670 [Candidatus Melainabacteria bacterium RIFCSPHIGHO2_02_FULL_34_12]
MTMKADGPKGHLGPRPKLGATGSRRVDDKPAVVKKKQVVSLQNGLTTLTDRLGLDVARGEVASSFSSTDVLPLGIDRGFG